MPDTVEHSPFGVRFGEAVANLKDKLPEASLAWDSLAGPVHAKVFTVAGATSADLASDLQRALVDARANGITIADFRKSFDATVQRHGWTYNGQRGWRTQVIFDANMRSSAMAGRWAQITANADRRPFLQYRTAGDARVRPQHKAWDGLVYPVADTFWQTHYPPNGWGCRCTVRAYSQADLSSKGLQVSEPTPLRSRDVRNRAGDVVDRVPVGIDPGWDHNVGRSWISPELALGAKLARLPRELQGLLIDKTISPAYQQAIGANWRAFRKAVAAGEKGRDDAQIVGWLDSDTLDGLATAVPGLKLDSTAVAALGSSLDKLQAWPSAWLAELHAELRSYSAVLWDKVDQAIVVVAAGELPGPAGRLGIAVLRPNTVTPYGTAIALDRLAAATSQALSQPGRYLPLVGKLPAPP